jgi:hypothetical protein
MRVIGHGLPIRYASIYMVFKVLLAEGVVEAAGFEAVACLYITLY